MKTRARSMTLFALTSVALGLTASLNVGASAQSPQTSNDPIAALLSEVHALRLAMERSAAMVPRVQVTLARLNIEEQRIGQLAAQVDQVRRQLADTTLDSQRTSDAVADIEKNLQTITDEKMRKQLEYEQTDLKRKLAAQAPLMQQLQTRENDAAQALGSEQARWIELNARLDELERLLAPVR